MAKRHVLASLGFKETRNVRFYHHAGRMREGAGQIEGWGRGVWGEGSR